jgi:hypothetical protein
LRNLRRGAVGLNSIAQLICDDEVGTFRECTVQDSFDYSQTIALSVYDYHWIFSTAPTLFEYSCYFGAIKCFKHVLGAAESTVHHEQLRRCQSCNCVHRAIAGGNTEILRTLESRQFNISGALHVAALFSRNNILDWLIDTKGTSLTESFGPLDKVVNNAVYAFNIYALRACLAHAVPIDGSLLFFAIDNCRIEMAIFLVETFDIDVRATQDGITSLIAAICEEQLDLVKCITQRAPGLITIPFKVGFSFLTSLCGS